MCYLQDGGEELLQLIISRSRISADLQSAEGFAVQTHLRGGGVSQDLVTHSRGQRVVYTRAGSLKPNGNENTL